MLLLVLEIEGCGPPGHLYWREEDSNDNYYFERSRVQSNNQQLGEIGSSIVDSSTETSLIITV